MVLQEDDSVWVQDGLNSRDNRSVSVPVKFVKCVYATVLELKAELIQRIYLF